MTRIAYQGWLDTKSAKSSSTKVFLADCTEPIAETTAGRVPANMSHHDTSIYLLSQHASNFCHHSMHLTFVTSWYKHLIFVTPWYKHLTFVTSWYKHPTFVKSRYISMQLYDLIHSIHCIQYTHYTSICNFCLIMTHEVHFFGVINFDAFILCFLPSILKPMNCKQSKLIIIILISEAQKLAEKQLNEAKSMAQEKCSIQ